MTGSHHLRYSAWTGSTAVEVRSPEEVLDALADSILRDGVDQTLSNALHHGLDDEREAGPHGLDRLRDQLRSAQRAALNDLASLTEPDAQPDASTMTSSEELQRLLSALNARAPSFAGMLRDSSPGLRSELRNVLEAGAPGFGSMQIDDMLDHLVDLSLLERQIRAVRSVDDLDAIDLSLLAKTLGQDAAQDVASLRESLRAFMESGYLQRRGTRTHLSSRAVQQIGETLLQQTVARLRSRGWGEHPDSRRSQRHELTGLSRDYQFGDPFELDLGQSLASAIRRRPGTPLELRQQDFRILDREGAERATTVLAIDLSRSMGERGYLLAAKRLALSLSTFIRKRYPHDELRILGFSESARPVMMQELVDLLWDRYGYGTNVHDALRVANGILAGHRGRKRNLVLITDGEPTAHRDTTGNVSFSHPPSPETLALTFREAARLRHDGVYLCVCLLSSTTGVSAFGRELARHAAGDVLVTDPNRLSADLIMTYRGRRG